MAGPRQLGHGPLVPVPGSQLLEDGDCGGERFPGPAATAEATECLAARQQRPAPLERLPDPVVLGERRLERRLGRLLVTTARGDEAAHAQGGREGRRSIPAPAESLVRLEPGSRLVGPVERDEHLGEVRQGGQHRRVGIALLDPRIDRRRQLGGGRLVVTDREGNRPERRAVVEHARARPDLLGEGDPLPGGSPRGGFVASDGLDHGPQAQGPRQPLGLPVLPRAALCLQGVPVSVDPGAAPERGKREIAGDDRQRVPIAALLRPTPEQPQDRDPFVETITGDARQGAAEGRPEKDALVLDEGGERFRLREQILREALARVEAREHRRQVRGAARDRILLGFHLVHGGEGHGELPLGIARHEPRRLGESLQDLAPKPMVARGLLQCLLEKARLRPPVIARPGVGEHPQGVGPAGAGHRGGDVVLEDCPGAGGVAGLDEVRAGRHDPPAHGVRLVGRRPARRFQRHLGGRVGAAARAGVLGSQVELGGHDLARLFGRQREMPRSLLLILGRRGQPGVEVTALSLVELPVRAGRDEGVGEPNSARVQLDDRGATGDVERIGRVRDRRDDQRGRGAPERGGGGQRHACRRRQGLQTVAHQITGHGCDREALEAGPEPGPLHQPGDLEREERVSPRLAVDPDEGWSAEREAELTANDLVDGVEVERSDVDALDRPLELRRRARQGRVREVGPDRRYEADVRLAQAPHGVLEHAGGGPVEPLQVVDGEDHRRLLGQGAQHPEGAERHGEGRRVDPLGRDPLEGDLERGALGRGKPVENRVQRRVEEVRETTEGELRLRLDGPRRHRPIAAPRGVRAHAPPDRRLADPGRSREDQGGGSPCRGVQERKAGGVLGVPADRRRRTDRATRGCGHAPSPIRRGHGPMVAATRGAELPSCGPAGYPPDRSLRWTVSPSVARGGRTRPPAPSGGRGPSRPRPERGFSKRGRARGGGIPRAR